MAYNTQAILLDKDGNPIPQYYNPATDTYEPSQGASGKLAVRASELETLLTAIGGYVDGLEGNDFATQTTLAAILTQLGTTGLKKIIDALPEGSNIIGKIGIDQTTPGTTNAVSIPTGSVSAAFTITPHDTNNLPQTTTALYLGGEGNIKVNLSGSGTPIIFKGLMAGVFYPIRATRVYITDTTATDIVGVY